MKFSTKSPMALLKDSLEKFGLTPKEASIYLALLELGRARVQQISQKTKLPRSTIYMILEELDRRGLVYTFEEKKVKYFAPEDPAKLVLEATEKLDLAKQISPDLKQLFREAQAQPQIRYYESKEEIEALYLSILKRRGLKEYDIIASEEEWLKIDPQFFERFKKRRAEINIRTRLILEYSETALARKAEERETLSEIKIIPPGFSWKFSAGCYIFEGSVIFVDYTKAYVAAEISSPAITSLLKAMFEFMWQFLAK